MDKKHYTVSTTIDVSFMQVMLYCPECKGGVMEPFMHHVKDDVQPGKTVSHYIAGDRCNNSNCGYEKKRETEMTLYTSNANDKFIQMVYEMRRAQKKYFETRDKRWLIESKQLETAVDKHLKDREQYSFNFDGI